MLRVDHIPLGAAPFDEVNVVVTAPAGGAPLKTVVDPATGHLTVARLYQTAMANPGTLGILPRTVAESGGPLAAFLPVTHILSPGMVIAARPVGVLYVSGSDGDEETVLAVPASRISSRFDRVRNYADLPSALLRQLSHYLSHAPDLEDDHDLRSVGWGDVDEARRAIQEATRRVRGPADLALD